MRCRSRSDQKRRRTTHHRSPAAAAKENGRDLGVNRTRVCSATTSCTADVGAIERTGVDRSVWRQRRSRDAGSRSKAPSVSTRGRTSAVRARSTAGATRDNAVTRAQQAVAHERGDGASPSRARETAEPEHSVSKGSIAIGRSAVLASESRTHAGTQPPGASLGSAAKRSARDAGKRHRVLSHGVEPESTSAEVDRKVGTHRGPFDY